MSKATPDAVQAMQEAMYHKKDEVVLKLDPLVRQHLEAFLSAFEEISSGTPFSVVDVINWACRYQAIRSSDEDEPNFVMPAIFHNAYALGRLLKKSQTELGIQFAGTYGNRAIYTVGRSEDA
jgi:hypothetical protein